MKYLDLYPEGLKPQRLYCPKCGDGMSLVFDVFDERVENLQIEIKNLPYLMCPQCKQKYLPDRSRISLIKIFEDNSTTGKTKFHSVRQKIDKRFVFGKVDFIYDPDDYFYIPGLIREGNDGFLTPVFFNKNVLIKFYNWPEYNISFASKTYGTIEKGNREYMVSFGINKSNKVVMWLGDISGLPDEEQHYLRSENIMSDHDIGSEFYDAQIEAEFTKLTPEDELIKAWSRMHNAFEKHFTEKSSHLDNESLELINIIIRPAVFTEKENKHVIDNLNKLCIETLNSANLEKLLTEVDKTAPRGTLKRLELLLQTHFQSNDISKLLSPFFVLYDLRISFLHLTSKEKQKETIDSALLRLNLRNGNFSLLYDELIKQITDSYNSIAKILSLA